MNKNLIIILFLFTKSFFCQEPTIAIDSTSIVSFTDKIFIKTHLDTEIDSYTVQTDGDSDLNLVTNNQFKFLVSVDYEFFGATFGWTPKFLPGNNDDDLKGHSSVKDYSFRFFPGNWIQKLQYKKTQGYYVENTDDFIPNWVEGQQPYILLPDFKTTIWSGMTSYVFNPKFSLKNVIYNTEWQRKSAGSFIPTVHYNYLHLSSKNVNNKKSYEDSFELKISPSYYYTFVINENWFSSLSLSSAIGIRHTQISQEDNSNKHHKTLYPISLDGGLQLGYSSEKLIFGAKLNFESTQYGENDQTNIVNSKVFATIYLGFRIIPPKAVKKFADKINTKLGLTKKP